LNSLHVDIIKGNAGEISTIAKIIGCDTESIAMRGVDSLGSGFSNPAAVVQAIAKRESKIGRLDSTRRSYYNYLSDEPEMDTHITHILPSVTRLCGRHDRKG
jgi:hypothetical protein